MRLLARLSCAFLLVLVVVSVVQLAGATDDPVTLAVLRRDGVIIPFATWNGKEWENRWPVPEAHAETPITFESIPQRWWGKTGPTRRWHVWQPDTGASTANVSAPAWFPAHCQQGLGLRLDLTLRPPVPPPTVQPYPKLGVASTRPLTVQPIQALEASAPLRAVLLQRLADLAIEEEARLTKQWAQRGWEHPYQEAERRALPLRIEAAYRMPSTAGTRVYYFEAVKRYPPPKGEEHKFPRPPGAEPCAAITFVSGFFESDDLDTRVLLGKPFVRITGCDYNGVSVMFPLAAVTIDAKPYWVVQFSNWGYESYAVMQRGVESARDVTTRFETPGGVCSTD